MDRDQLRGKKVAIVDDTLFTGRSLNKVADRLQGLGVAAVAKFAFIVIDEPNIASYRHAHDITSCTAIPQSEFQYLLDDLSALSMRQRPVNPDHLLFSICPASRVSSNALVNEFTRFGFVVEYARDPNAIVCSIHYPSFSPAAPISDRGIDKIRITIKKDGDLIAFCPAVFPPLPKRMASKNQPDAKDEIWCELHKAMSLAHQDDKARRQNLYESFTISARIRQAAGFLTILRSLGVSFQDFTLDGAQLKRYYGATVGSRVLGIVDDKTKLLLNSNSTPSEDQHEASESLWLDFPNAFSLDQRLLTALQQAYHKRNEGESDLYLWKSAGLSIRELAERTKMSPYVISVGMEHLNDYGYATPLMREDSALERTYRSTEIGTARLAL